MSQATRILLALVAGLVLGIAAFAWAPGFALSAANVADPIGTLWLNGLRMTIVPLVVALLITGIAQTAEAARAGEIAGRALAGEAGGAQLHPHGGGGGAEQRQRDGEEGEVIPGDGAHQPRQQDLVGESGGGGQRQAGVEERAAGGRHARGA